MKKYFENVVIPKGYITKNKVLVEKEITIYQKDVEDFYKANPNFQDNPFLLEDEILEWLLERKQNENC